MHTTWLLTTYLLCLLNHLSTFHNSLWPCVFWSCMLPSSSVTCSSLLIYVCGCLCLLLCPTCCGLLSLFFLCLPLPYVFSHTCMHCYPNYIVLAHVSFFCLTCPIGHACLLLVICLHFVHNTVFCCLFCWLFSWMLVFSNVFAVLLLIFVVTFPCDCVVLCSACLLQF